MRFVGKRDGIAIPMVAGFCFLAVVFGFMMSVIRVEDKRQNLMNFQQLKAYYMAQAAIQHALLKIRVLPNEIYEASALARGVCPFTVEPADGAAGTVTNDLLVEFVSDVNSSTTSGVPLVLAVGEEANWAYRVNQVRALTTFTKVDSSTGSKAEKVNVLEFDAQGYIEDKLSSGGPTGSEKRRWEKVTKIVEITRRSR